MSMVQVLDIIALSGGKFGSLRIIATFFFSFFIPLLRNQYMLEQIGEVRKKRSPIEMTLEGEDLETRKEEAIQSVSNRQKVTSTVW